VKWKVDFDEAANVVRTVLASVAKSVDTVRSFRLFHFFFLIPDLSPPSTRHSSSPTQPEKSPTRLPRSSKLVP
jgi:hypothetical protein